MKDESVYLDCDCVGACTALHLMPYQREEEPGEGPRIYATIYRKAEDRGKRFWRLRAAWYAFRHGEWGGAEICLDEQRVVKLMEVCAHALGNPKTGA